MKWRFRVEQVRVKKYERLLGYTALAHSTSSFLSHCAYKFRNRQDKPYFSEWELKRAEKQNKIIVIAYLNDSENN